MALISYGRLKLRGQNGQKAGTHLKYWFYGDDLYLNEYRLAKKLAMPPVDHGGRRIVGQKTPGHVAMAKPPL